MMPVPARDPRAPLGHDPFDAARRAGAFVRRGELRCVLLRLGLLACAGLLWVLPAL
jgi:hypothetical protein